MTTADDSRAEGYDGRVEQLDELFGVAGWAFDRADPSATLTLELCADRRVLATTQTGLERADVCSAFDVYARPGFRFDEAAREAIREAAAQGHAGELMVRVAGDRGTLATMAPPRSLELVRLGTMGGPPTNRDALVDRLSVHVRAARETLDQAFRPMPGRGAGFIESIALDDSGITWVIGWMVDEQVFDRPMVIVDSGKHAAGLAYAMVSRDDLPPGSKGFVGILQTDWRASSDIQPYFFLADGTQRFLESLEPTPIRSKAQIAPMVRGLLANAEGGYRDLLSDLFHSVYSWAVLDDPHAKDLLRVDEVAILPSFGAFVKGWSLSPSKDPDRLVMKAGNRIMVAEDRTVTRHVRPDLTAIYPNVGLALERAGFVATFRGDLDGARLDEMVLKTTWSDGSATNEAIEAGKIRMLGVTAPLDSVSSFYPAIEAEPFFADFARHAAAAARSRSRIAKTYEVAPVRGVLILAAPGNASDLFLSIDTAIRYAAHLPSGWGIAIVARSDALRPLLVSLFSDLKRATGKPCSLFFVADADAASDALLDVLDKLGADRFAFCGARTLLSAEGWQAIAGSGEGLKLLGIDDLAAEGGSTDAGLSAFLCDTATWQRVASETPPQIGGATLRVLPADVIPTERAMPGAALALAARRVSPFAARINDIDGTTHG